MGLGLHGGGVGTAKFLARNGAKVTVTDLKTPKELAAPLRELRGLNIKYVLGRHEISDFVHADIVVYNPGVRAKFMHLEDSPFLAAAINNGVRLDTDIGMFFDLIGSERIIGVTGSKGKSTTASLIRAMLRQKYSGTLLAGNIRTSVFEILTKAVKDVPVVLELSSWQLEGLALRKKSPHLAVITNVLHEHLNTYGSFRDYVEAKKNVMRFQTRNDEAILNGNLKKMPEFAKPCGNGRRHWFVGGRIKPDFLRSYALPGRHNKENLAAALRVAKLYGIFDAQILRTLEQFKSLEGRLEKIARINGVNVINDTTATMPDAVMSALKSFNDPGKIILIAGGVDKAFDWQPLAKFLNSYSPKELILLPGSGTDKLISELQAPPINRKSSRLAGQAIKRAYSAVSSMSEAVNYAWLAAKRGDIILLSPGGASFNLFKNEFDRGDEFKKAIKKHKA